MPTSPRTGRQRQEQRPELGRPDCRGADKVRRAERNDLSLAGRRALMPCKAAAFSNG